MLQPVESDMPRELRGFQNQLFSLTLSHILSLFLRYISLIVTRLWALQNEVSWRMYPGNYVNAMFTFAASWATNSNPQFDSPSIPPLRFQNW